MTECPTCRVHVLPTDSGHCPGCRHPLGEGSLTPGTEPEAPADLVATASRTRPLVMLCLLIAALGLLALSGADPSILTFALVLLGSGVLVSLRRIIKPSRMGIEK